MLVVFVLSVMVLLLNVMGVILIMFELFVVQFDFGVLKLLMLCVYLYGEQLFVVVFIDCLFVNVFGVYVEFECNGCWIVLCKLLIVQVGFVEDDVLIDYLVKLYFVYWLFIEYFVFFDKFDFVDFDFVVIVCVLGCCQCVMLYLVLQDVCSDLYVVCLFELLMVSYFWLFCMLIVNLFCQYGELICIMYCVVLYLVIVEVWCVFVYEVYLIDLVKFVWQQVYEELVIEFWLFYLLYYGEVVWIGYYWFVWCNDWVVQKSFGYEIEILIVDIDFELMLLQIDMLSFDFICMNCDLLVMLVFGFEGGDLFQEGGVQMSGILLLCCLMQSVCFECGCVVYWWFVLYFVFNYVLFVVYGFVLLKEMLMLYDL